MAVLVLLLPPRSRSPAAGSPSGLPAEFSWVLSPDGARIGRQGSGLLGALPAADSVVAVVPPTDIAWHRIDLPRAPAARLRAALSGLLEERLLEEPDTIHPALQPGAQAGQPTWVAVLHRPWLKALADALHAQGRQLDRLLPLLAPGGDAQVHAFVPGGLGLQGETETGGRAWVAAVQAGEALCVPIDGAGMLLQPWRDEVAWSASPAAAVAAERVLGRPVPVRGEAELALAALQGRWQLLQFELAPQRRAWRQISQAVQALRSPAWRAVRWGLVSFAAVNLLGLNAYAWQQRRAVDAERLAMAQLLRDTHPQVGAVLDAPLQMQRETERLREATGQLGERDLESMLGALTRSWPSALPMPTQWQYEGGRLSVPQALLPAPQAEALRLELRAAGWSLQSDGSRWWLQPADARGPGS